MAHRPIQKKRGGVEFDSIEIPLRSVPEYAGEIPALKGKVRDVG
jgi:hypothetical protein